MKFSIYSEIIALSIPEQIYDWYDNGNLVKLWRVDIPSYKYHLSSIQHSSSNSISGLSGTLTLHRGMLYLFLVPNNENLLERHFNKILPKLEAYNMNPLEYNIGKLKSLPKNSVLLIFNLATFKLIEQNFENLNDRNFVWICASQRIADYVDSKKCGKTLVAKSPTYEDMLNETQ